MILSQQRMYALSSSRLEEFLRALRQALRLGRRDCNVCFVDDRRIKQLNALYRGKKRATDVLSFPWNTPRSQPRVRARNGRAQSGQARRDASKVVTPGSDGARLGPTRRSRDGRAAREFRNFLGDIVISVETAGRNARREGHSTLNEIRWLILHGVLHLLGYDHEKDDGEMTRLELALRSRMGIAGD